MLYDITFSCEYLIHWSQLKALTSVCVTVSACACIWCQVPPPMQSCRVTYSALSVFNHPPTCSSLTHFVTHQPTTWSTILNWTSSVNQPIFNFQKILKKDDFRLKNHLKLHLTLYIRFLKALWPRKVMLMQKWFIKLIQSYQELLLHSALKPDLILTLPHMHFSFFSFFVKIIIFWHYSTIHHHSNTMRALSPWLSFQ